MNRRGSISRRSEGSWTIQASGGFHEGTGKRVRKTVTVKGSRAEAERTLTKLLREIDTGQVADPGRLTLQSYMDTKWLPHAATRVRATTHERYVSLMRRHVFPRIGRLQLGKLRPMHI